MEIPVWQEMIDNQLLSSIERTRPYLESFVDEVGNDELGIHEFFYLNYALLALMHLERLEASRQLPMDVLCLSVRAIHEIHVHVAFMSKSQENADYVVGLYLVNARKAETSFLHFQKLFGSKPIATQQQIFDHWASKATAAGIDIPTDKMRNKGKEPRNARWFAEQCGALSQYDALYSLSSAYIHPSPLAAGGSLFFADLSTQQYQLRLVAAYCVLDLLKSFGPALATIRTYRQQRAGSVQAGASI